MEIKEKITDKIFMIICIIDIVFLFSAFIGFYGIVIGPSMEDTLHEHNLILVNKLPHTFRMDYEYGDIVVIDKEIDKKRTIQNDITDILYDNILTYCLTKEIEGKFFAKRIIGKEGDLLVFKDGILTRNGKVLHEPYIKEEMKDEPWVVIVPENHYFVMGDNRNNSMDSRHLGCIPKSHIIGKCILKK